MFKQYIIISYLFMILLSPLQSSEKENHFIIAINPEYIPFTQKDIEGNPAGLQVDFWKLWAQKNNYTVTFKFYPLMEILPAVKSGEVDFSAGTLHDQEWVLTSDVIYKIKASLFTVKGSSISHARDMQNKKLGVINRFYGKLVRDIIGEGMGIEVYATYSELVSALKQGKIDALIDEDDALKYYFIKTGQLNKFQKVNDAALQFDKEVYAVTNKNNPVMIEQINKGIEKLDLADLAELEKVWLPSIQNAYYNVKLSKQVEYTKEEKEWLKKYKNLTLTGDPVWTQCLDEDNVYKYRGVIGDYIQSISQKMNIDFRMHPICSWAEALAVPHGEHSEVVLGTMNNRLKKLLEEDYDFLEPYEAGPLVIIMDGEIRFVMDLQDLKDKKIGLLSLQNYTKQVQFKYNEHEFYEYSKVSILLESLLEKEIDVVLLPLPDAILSLAESEYDSLDIVGKMHEKVYVNIGVLQNNPKLKSIIKKAFISTSINYNEEILSKWTRQLNYVEKVDYTLTYLVAGFLGLLLMTIGYYANVTRKKHRYAESLRRKMEALTLKDALTELPNKRAFNKNFENLHHDKSSLGFLFIDVDHFKKYNDYYGHMKGDIALREVSKVLQSFTSDSCFVYRIGGEEFGFVLYDYEEEDAVTLAESICRTIEDLKMEHQDSSFKYITVSIGVAIGDSSMDRHILYQCADKALYSAKALGRNRVALGECRIKRLI